MVSDSELANCGQQDRYAVYGIIHGWVYDYTFYGDKYPQNGGECSISHDKDGRLGYTKLNIKCSG